MIESNFQRGVIADLKERFPGCVVMKNDSGYIQGIPDLTILYKNRWATLEVKKSARASHRPNQDYYVEKMKEMSYSAFVYPENKEEIMDELASFFNAPDGACAI